VYFPLQCSLLLSGHLTTSQVPAHDSPAPPQLEHKILTPHQLACPSPTSRAPHQHACPSPTCTPNIVPSNTQVATGHSLIRFHEGIQVHAKTPADLSRAQVIHTTFSNPASNNLAAAASAASNAAAMAAGINSMPSASGLGGLGGRRRVVCLSVDARYLLCLCVKVEQQGERQFAIGQFCSLCLYWVILSSNCRVAVIHHYFSLTCLGLRIIAFVILSTSATWVFQTARISPVDSSNV